MKIEGRLRVRRLKEGIRMKHVTSERRATSAGGEEHTHRGERRGEAAHTGETGKHDVCELKRCGGGRKGWENLGQRMRRRLAEVGEEERS